MANKKGGQSVPKEEADLTAKIEKAQEAFKKMQAGAAADKAKADIATDREKLGKMKFKRLAGIRLGAFQKAAARLAGVAGAHSDAQKDFVLNAVTEACEPITDAFNRKAPAAKSAVAIPD